MGYHELYSGLRLDQCGTRGDHAVEMHHNSMNDLYLTLPLDSVLKMLISEVNH